MKLSKAQEKVLNTAKERIDYARTHDLYDWWRKGHEVEEWTNEQVEDQWDKFSNRYNGMFGKEYEMKLYEKNVAGIDYLCQASKATLAKLEELGLIEIIYDSSNTSRRGYGFDEIRLLNY